MYVKWKGRQLINVSLRGRKAIHAIESMTGRSAEEIRRGQATELAVMERAEAIERFFLSDTSFGELLVLFEMNLCPHLRDCVCAVDNR
eukprot:COSAG01_NODE_3255_length_6346_cov_14.579638_3_plen_88_part_00